jgi:hypothetical protein
VSLSFLPVIASLVLIILGQFLGALNISPDKLPLRLQHLHQTLTMLSNGFILTGLLWGSRLAFLIDHRAKLAALCAFVCAVLTLFGVNRDLIKKFIFIERRQGVTKSPDFDSKCGFSQKNINNINESVREFSKV